MGKYRTGRWNQRTVNKITTITVHHSAVDLKLGFTKEETLKNIQYTHEKVKGWPGASYHFVVFEDEVWQINDFKDVTWHDSHNYDSIGVLVPGYFHTPVFNVPTKKTLGMLKLLLDELCTRHPEFPADQNDVWGHGERSATACPGSNLLPYVKEYREKLGNVKWTGDEELPSEPSDDGQEVLIDKTKRMPEWLRDGLGLTEGNYPWFKVEDAPDTLWDKVSDWYNDSKELTMAKDRVDELEDKIRDLESSLLEKEDKVQDLEGENRKLGSEMRLQRSSYELTIDGLETRLKGLETQLEGLGGIPENQGVNNDIIRRYNELQKSFENLSKEYAVERKKRSLQKLVEELEACCKSIRKIINEMHDKIKQYLVKNKNGTL